MVRNTSWDEYLKAGMSIRTFRVVDTQRTTAELDALVTAHTPEAAAQQVLGFDLVRSGPPRSLRAKVYFQEDGQPMTMVRLYIRATDE